MRTTTAPGAGQARAGEAEVGRPLRVLIGCETSGVVRRAFSDRGHDAWSCDLLPAEDGSNHHMVCDIRDVLGEGWDLLAVMHPPCTRLCNSGVRWLHVPPPGRTLAEMWAELDAGAALFRACWDAPIERVAVENPVMHRHARERLPGLPRPQIVQPWHFGEPFFKATGFYLRGLPPLIERTGSPRRSPGRPSTRRGPRSIARRPAQTVGASAAALSMASPRRLPSSGAVMPSPTRWSPAMDSRLPPDLARRAEHQLRPADQEALRRLYREREAERGRLLVPALAAVALLCVVAAVGLIAAGLRPY